MTTAGNAVPDNNDLQATLMKGGLTAEGLLAIVGVLLKKEANLALKEEEYERKKAASDARARESSNQFTIAKIEAQKNCKHLKGGSSRKRGQQKDYNLYSHTFTDGKIVIKCNSCGAKWFEGDTVEYLHRNGNAIPNWTRVGYTEAVYMLEESSNKPSSSEIFRKTKTGVTVVEQKVVQAENLQL